MNTYRVVIGTSASITTDVKIVRAKNAGEAEKKALKAMDKLEGIHATLIEELETDQPSLLDLLPMPAPKAKLPPGIAIIRCG